MQVKDIMVSEVKTCRPDTDLAAAVQLMWTNDCGVLPVVDDQGQVVGMITDRDICIAVGNRNRPPSELTVFDVKTNPRELYTCAPEDDIHQALQTMQTHGVRRLPAISNGKLRGVLCLKEIALGARKRNALTYDDLVETLKAVCEYRAERQAVAA